MAKEDRIQHGILGDINPTRPDRSDSTARPTEKIVDESDRMESDESMQGGSRHDESRLNNDIAE